MADEVLLNLTLFADRCHSDAKSYIVPVARCYNPAQRFKQDPQWGHADILDSLISNGTQLNRSFFKTTDGSCEQRTGGFVLPLDTCVGPWGRPRSMGTISIVRSDDDDEGLCRAHVAAHAKDVRREAKGALHHPYLVPAGPYNQLWDWDSVFLGVATLDFGNQAYFAGSMQNFFEATNLTTGAVTGCLTWNLPVVCSSSPKEHDALVHAKPILIQGAWLAANSSSNGNGQPPSAIAAWERHAPAIEALLNFWSRPPRRDPATGLRTWHDQMESGADNGVLSLCPNARSSCWTESQAYSLASPDVLTLLQREHTAAAHFYDAWAAAATTTSPAASASSASSSSASSSSSVKHRAAARRHRQQADSLRRILNAELWREDLGYHVALNASSRARIPIATDGCLYGLHACHALDRASATTSDRFQCAHVG